MIKLKNNILYYIKTNSFNEYQYIVNLIKKYNVSDIKSTMIIKKFLQRKETIFIYFEIKNFNNKKYISIGYDYNLNIIPEKKYKKSYKNIINIENYLLINMLLNIKKYKNDKIKK